MFSSPSSLKVRNQVCWYSSATTVLGTGLMRFTQPTQEQTVSAASNREPLPMAATPVHIACCMPELDETPGGRNAGSTSCVGNELGWTRCWGGAAHSSYRPASSLSERISCRTIWFPSTIKRHATGGLPVFGNTGLASEREGASIPLLRPCDAVGMNLFVLQCGTLRGLSARMPKNFGKDRMTGIRAPAGNSQSTGLGLSPRQ